MYEGELSAAQIASLAAGNALGSKVAASTVTDATLAFDGFNKMSIGASNDSTVESFGYSLERSTSALGPWSVVSTDIVAGASVDVAITDPGFYRAKVQGTAGGSVTKELENEITYKPSAPPNSLALFQNFGDAMFDDSRIESRAFNITPLGSTHHKNEFTTPDHFKELLEANGWSHSGITIVQEDSITTSWGTNFQEGTSFVADGSATAYIEKDLPDGTDAVYIMYGCPYGDDKITVEITDNSGSVVASDEKTVSANTKPGETVLTFPSGNYKIRISEFGTSVAYIGYILVNAPGLDGVPNPYFTSACRPSRQTDIGHLPQDGRLTERRI